MHISPSPDASFGASDDALRELQAGSPLKGRMVRFVETKLTAARQADHGQ